jgi:hypothetical protein
MSANLNEPLNPSRQGWKQFLTSRTKMLNAFDQAKVQDALHEVQIYRGQVAEAEFREWLSSFLPKKYGITSGYVISQGVTDDVKVPHFDIIIYEELESPILWIEKNPDRSSTGSSRAIPAEYVRAIIEVKSSFSSANVTDAIKHLFDLTPLLVDVDAPDERYKRHLPSNFFSATVFFELRAADKNNFSALEKYRESENLRGFFGGLILRGEDLPPNSSGRIFRLHFPEETHQPRKDKSILGGFNAIHIADGDYWALMWADLFFAIFAFDLLAMLNNTYDGNRLSSLHAFGSDNLRIAQ